MAVPRRELKDSPWEDWSLLNGLNECESKALSRGDSLSSPWSYRESCCRRSCPLFDVFPWLQVTKARRLTTFSLVIIARLKGSPGYVYRTTAKEKEREKGIRANRFPGKLYDFKESSHIGLGIDPQRLACTPFFRSFHFLVAAIANSS